MKKTLVITIACLSLVAMQSARATGGTEITAEGLRDGGGILIGQNALVLMVVDTANNGLISSNMAPFSVGGVDGSMMHTVIPGTDDVIVWRGTPAETTGTDGAIDFAATIAYGLDGVAAGAKYGLVWFTGASASGPYGSVINASYVLPPDGLNNGPFDEVADHSAGPQQVIPEPSSISLVVLGVLGAVGMIRRRRS